MRLAILVPHKDIVYFPWAANWPRIRLPQGTSFVYNKGPAIDYGREALVGAALSAPANERPTHLLFLDDDVVVPPNTVRMLHRWRYPAVSGLYWRRDTDSPAMNVYMAQDDGTFLSVKSFGGDIDGARAFHADGVGIGVCMIESWVFDRLSRPWFRFTETEVEPSELDSSDPTEKRIPRRLVGEDLNFFLKIRRELGIRVLVDPSVECAHLTMVGIERGALHVQRI